MGLRLPVCTRVNVSIASSRVPKPPGKSATASGEQISKKMADYYFNLNVILVVPPGSQFAVNPSFLAIPSILPFSVRTIP